MREDDEEGERSAGSGGLRFLGGLLKGLALVAVLLVAVSVAWPPTGTGEGAGETAGLPEVPRIDPPADGAGADEGPGDGDAAGSRRADATRPAEPGVGEGTAPAPPDPPDVPDASGTGRGAAPGGGEIALDGPALALNAAAFDAPPETPLVAVVLRDPGPGAIQPETLLSLRLPLTIALTPGTARSDDLARAAARGGYEVVAEISVAGPEAATEEGGMALRAGMTDLEIAERTQSIMSALWMAVGATGRLGEDAVLDERILRGMLAVLGQHGYGLLGIGAGRNVMAEAVADALDVPFARRDVELGDGVDADAAYDALERAAEAARSDGVAVVSAPGTLPVLQGLQRWALERSGTAARLAPLSAAIRRRSES